MNTAIKIFTISMTGNKNYVCKVDNRRFATSDALRQHTSSSHGGDRAKPASKRASRRSKRGGGGGGIAPVATGSGGFGQYKATNSVRLSGVERWRNFDLASGESGTKIVLFRHDELPRLGLSASGFDRIIYHSLSIEVVSKASTATGGGYVAAFIPDPCYERPDILMAAATPGAVSKKWWESALVKAMVPKTKLYTSPSSEPRISSPGIFIFVIDGKPTNSVNITLNVRWDVTLSIPSLEKFADEPGEPLELVTQNFATIQQNTRDLYILPANDFSKSYDQMPIAGSMYILPSLVSIEYKEGTGDTGTYRCSMVKFEQATDGMRATLYSDDKTAAKQKWQSDLTTQVALPPFSVLKLWKKAGPAPPAMLTQKSPESETSTGAKSEEQLNSSETISNQTLGVLIDSLKRLETRLEGLEIASVISRLEKPTSLASSICLAKATLSRSSSMELIKSPYEEIGE